MCQQVIRQRPLKLHRRHPSQTFLKYAATTASELLWLWSIYIKWERQATEAEQRNSTCFLFLRMKNCFQMSSMFEGKETKGGGTQVINISLFGKERGTMYKWIKWYGVIHFTCFFIEWTTNMVVRLQGLKSFKPGFKSWLRQSLATQP